MTKDDNTWPFPSVSLQRVKNATGRDVWSLSGLDIPGIESYLSRFGVIPANGGMHGSRKLVRPGPDGDWIVTDPCGTTPLEHVPELVRDMDEARECLTTHTWYAVGFTANPTVIEFSFSSDGEGFSRYMVSGFQSKAPTVLDAYWRYVVQEGSLHISWDEGPPSDISFELQRQLRVAPDIRNGTLGFFEATLTVGQHLFPPGSGFPDGWLKEYWGQRNAASSGET